MLFILSCPTESPKPKAKSGDDGGSSEWVFGTVISPKTGRVWLDRNLGADRVPTTKNDTAGEDLYQWGRGADGHQLSNSEIKTTAADSITPNHNQFIIEGTAADWTNTTTDKNGALRSAAWAVGGINAICPAGFEVPTETELQAEIGTADGLIDGGTTTAFGTFLKLPQSEKRDEKGMSDVAGLWTRTPKGTENAQYLNFVDLFRNKFEIEQAVRHAAFPIRCIKKVVM